jgi:hypothetical protein
MSFDLTKNMPQGIKANFTEAKSRIEDIENLKGAVNGYAELDANGFVPLVQLPAGVKDSKVVADITARDAIASGERFEGLRVHVLDATGDVTVSTGGAGYILMAGLTNSDWAKTYETESLDLDVSEFFVKNTDTSDDISEGSTNLFFTDSRAKSAAVVNDMSGSEADQAGSVSSVKDYVDTAIASVSPKWVKKTSTGTLSASEGKVYCNITALDIVLTLPVVGSTEDGQTHVILNKSTSTKNVTVAPDATHTVNGGANLVLAPGEYVEFIYEHSATNWFIKE